jgi:hypothetical protein
LAEAAAGTQLGVNDNFIHFLKQRPEVFPFRRDIDLQRFLVDALDRPVDALPQPAKIFLADELEPKGFGFPVTKAAILDELEQRLDRWLTDEIAVRVTNTATKERAEESLLTYRVQVVKIARNALTSSILADYHSVFWLLHSQQLAKLFTALPKKVAAAAPNAPRDQGDTLKYTLYGRWAHTIREAMVEITARDGELSRVEADADVRFLELLAENPLIPTEDFVSNELKELRSYFAGALRRDFNSFKRWFDDLRTKATELMKTDRLFRRSIALLGYPETAPNFIALLDRRVQQLVSAHPSWHPAPEQAFNESLSRRLLEFFIVYYLRRGIFWMKTSPDGDNVSDDGHSNVVYSRAIRPMNFGRRGIVEPIVYRYGLVYDITSFTQTLGEVARGGKGEEQHSYRQMLEFQRDLADITRRHGLQFEKFLGDGAFYTSRRAVRTIQAAIEIQQFYASMREKGFAFNKGMRIALNYGYYRLLPMQVSSEGAQIREFYGPGIVELSRLTSGKATKELEDIQHLLLSHGYDQNEVYRFFAPLSRSVGRTETAVHREFYAYVNENGHLINEGIVVSIPFLQRLSAELVEEEQRIYRLRTEWAVYVGFPAASRDAGYIGVRLLGSVSLKGIGNQDVAEIVRVTHDDAEVSLVDEPKPLMQLLEQERNRSAARNVAENVEGADPDAVTADLVVCESHLREDSTVILVGEWDPVSEEVRRPIQLDGTEAERYGLAVPLTEESVGSQSVAYQKLYRKLSRLETLPSFSVQAIRANVNFSGFIIGERVERL